MSLADHVLLLMLVDPTDPQWRLTPDSTPTVVKRESEPPAGFSAPLSSWSTAETWDDGAAEVATYAAHGGEDAHPGSYEATLITVKEAFDLEAAVKAEPPYDEREVVDVLKLNWIQEVWTPRSPRHWLTSIFVRRDDPSKLLKETHGSQEWDGNYFRCVETRDGQVVDSWSSYVEGESEGRQSLDLEDLMTPEQLILTLRAVEPASGLTFSIPVARSLVSHHYTPLEVDAALVRFQGPIRLRVGDDDREAWKVIVKGQDFLWKYWYGTGPDRPLLKLEGPDVNLELKNLERRAYWNVTTGPETD